MKIVAYDRFKPGVTFEQVKPFLKEEADIVWKLYSRGVVREFGLRNLSHPSILLIFECQDLEEFHHYVQEFP